MSPATHVVGRERELAWLEANVAPGRVVAVTGLGGIGKTALVSAFCARARPERIVSLGAPVREGRGLVEALGRAFGLGAKADLNVVEAALAGAPPSLVRIDETEGLPPEERVHLARWVEHGNVGWIVTSRLPLGLAAPAERALELPLGPLSADASRALFIALAGADEADAERWRSVLGQLDGHALAIALAAGWARYLGPRDLEEMLAGAPRELPDATLDGILGWSFERLTLGQREVLLAASCFVSGFERERLAAVLGRKNVAADLFELVRKSLVVPDTSRGAFDRAEDGAALGRDSARFRLLAPVRQFARARAGAELTERFERDLVERAPKLAAVAFRDGEWASLEALAALEPDIVAVLPRLRERDPAGAAALTFALGPVAWTFGPLAQWLELLCALPDGVGARRELTIALVCSVLGHLDEGSRQAWAAMPCDDGERFEQEVVTCELLYARRGVDPELDERAAALDPARSDDPFVRARRHSLIARMALSTFRFADAIVAYRNAAAELQRAGGHFRQMSWIEIGLALAHLDGGSAEHAEVLLQKQLVAPHHRFDRRQRGYVEGMLGACAHQQGDLVEAEARFRSAAARARRLSDKSLEGYWLGNRLLVAVEVGPVAADALDAERLLEVAAASQEEPLIKTAWQAVGALWAELGMPAAPEAFARAAEVAPDVATGGEVLALLGRADALREREPVERDRAIHGLLAELAALPETTRIAGLCRRVVRAALTRRIGERPLLEVGEDAAWFALDGAAAVSLGNRPVLRRLLASLAAEAAHGSLDNDALIARVWPGERLLHDAARARLHVLVATLRKLGLAEVLARDDHGYRLLARVVVGAVGPA